MKNLVLFSLLILPSLCVASEATNSILPVRECQVNAEIQRFKIPPTPNNMSLPAYGQGIIGWGTGPEGAQAKLQTVNQNDIKHYKEKDVTLLIVQQWHAFYTNEKLRNPCNPTAPIRAALMQKIMNLWE